MRIVLMLVAALALAGGAVMSQAREALAATPGSGARIIGAVKTVTPVNQINRGAVGPVPVFVKLPDTSGGFKASVELQAASLKSLIERAVIEKKEDDGFNRPLDTYVVVTGRDGAQAVFSWGEIFLAGDGMRVVVADRARLLMPHHHKPVGMDVYDTVAWMTPGERATRSIESCATCHDGAEHRRLVMPQGIIVAAPSDPWPPRTLDGVESIEVRQIGVKVEGAKGGATRSEKVTLRTADGVERPFAATVAGLPRGEVRDAVVGMSRGFKGVHAASGVRLRPLVEKLLARGTPLRSVVVLVTGSDGYRAVVSGGELERDEALLADREDGTPLAGADGRYRLVLGGDAFIDRSIRAVREIRVIQPQQ